MQPTPPRSLGSERLRNLDSAGVDIVANQILEYPTALIGTVDEIVADLQQARAQYGFSFIVINDDQIDAFAPIVAQLNGT